jgi:hypothetical protein
MSEEYERFSNLPDSKRQNIEEEAAPKDSREPGLEGLRKKDLQEERIKRRMQREEEEGSRPSQLLFKDFLRVDMPDDRLLFERLEELQQNSQSRDDFGHDDESLKELERLIAQEKQQASESKYSSQFESYRE